MLAEERKDATTSVAGRRLVIVGCDQNSEQFVETREVIEMAVIEKKKHYPHPVNLDVVNDARCEG